MKRLLPIIFWAIYNLTNAQIAITEVYYDTPYSEEIHYVRENKTRLGEFIELYNYTTEDLSLDRWFMSDNYASYYFPKGIVIKSGEFLVVAYKAKPEVPDYFTKFFPTTKGQESKIIYQDKLLLNNFQDHVKLNAPVRKDKFLELDLPFIVMEKVEWKDPAYAALLTKKEKKEYIRKHYNFNFQTLEGDGSGVDYYINSLQKTDNPQEKYYNEKNRANPLSALYKPAIGKYEEAPPIINVYKEHYGLLTWAWYVSQILNNTCNYGIPVVDQPYSQYVLTSTEQCFGHDIAGNVSSKGCLLGSQNPNSTNNLQDNPELIKNRIQVYPNPTSSLVTITWDNEVDSLIAQMRIVSLSAAFDITVPKNVTGYTYSADLTLQPAGIYILSVTLTSGQTISKNIIKL